MFAALPLIFYLVVVVAFQAGGQSGERDVRAALLAAAVTWGVVVTAITELLSLVGLLTFGGLLVAWSLALAAVAGVVVARMARNSESWGDVVGLPARSIVAGGVTDQLPGRLVVLGVVTVGAAVGLIAIVAPPHNWDSMVYHMSRVVHWMQNQSLAFFPTQKLQELSFAPWAEYAILQFQVLTSADRLANGVQWFALVGSVVGASLLAKELGAGATGQLFSAAVAMSIPMAILQGSTTQNDLVVSFWLVCVACYGLRFRREATWKVAVAIGASLGLAVLTKATAYLYAFPFVVWVAAAAWRRLGSAAWRPALLAAAAALVLNLGQYSRNLELFGSPLGQRTFEVTSDEQGVVNRFTITKNIFANEAVSPALIFSNLVRNAALHLGTPVPGVNAALEKGILRVHEWLDVDPSDPRTTWPGLEFRVRALEMNENRSGNPLHFVLLLSAVGLVAIRPRRAGDAFPYGLALAMGFLLFVAYLKWQPYHSRLHLPLFLLGAPLVGVTFEKRTGARFLLILGLALLLAATPWVLRNEKRLLLSRTATIFHESRDVQYFNTRPAIREAYMEAARRVDARGCDDVGLIVGIDEWEYPFWVLIEADGGRPTIRHVAVKNVSREAARSRDRAFVPCAVIEADRERFPDEARGEAFVLNAIRYVREWEERPVILFIPEEGSDRTF